MGFFSKLAKSIKKLHNTSIGGLPSPADTMDPGGFAHSRDSEYYKYDPFNKGFSYNDAAQEYTPPAPFNSRPRDQLFTDPGTGGGTVNIGGGGPPPRQYVQNPFAQQMALSNAARFKGSVL